MMIIHDMTTLPRLVETALAERLRAMPAVVVTGARQTGKSTLVERLVPGERRYVSLDDLDVLDAARRDPQVLVGGPGPITLDEVQREPDLLRAVQASRRSRPHAGTLPAHALGEPVADERSRPRCSLAARVIRRGGP